ncbi:MAG: carboxyl transferase domain-containing protein, partial [Bifidobacterium breve]|nr:carboxyl transferase domain-containing protein [Bifidobacterium breve]
MTDIMDSPAVNAVTAASATNASQPPAHQPLRTAVVKAAELARAAEERARDKQHAKGKKTARERLDLLFDTGTFEEIGRFQGGNIAGGNAGAAVITGFGQVYGRKVAVYAQDFSVKGGTLGTAEGEKICRLMDMAIDLK